MTRRLALLAFAALVAAGCGAEKPKDPNALSKEPISVRGWIADVEQPPSNVFRTTETEAARKVQLFQSTNVFVENAPYVSGGVAENGAFVLLDVPPGKVVLTFQAPGAPASRVMLENVPGNADVYLPAILLQSNGTQLLEPQNVKVRMAAKIDKPHPTGRSATVNGRPVPIVETPIAEMQDRRDWPTPPGSAAPVATVK